MFYYLTYIFTFIYENDINVEVFLLEENLMGIVALYETGCISSKWLDGWC